LEDCNATFPQKGWVGLEMNLKVGFQGEIQVCLIAPEASSVETFALASEPHHLHLFSEGWLLEPLQI
jgi:hypothetical protein